MFRNKQIDFLARDDDMNIVAEIFENNSYSRHGWDMKKGQVWLDLGANIGLFALWLEAQEMKVICFEPEQKCFKLLQQNRPGENYQLAVTANGIDLPLYGRSKKPNSRFTIIEVRGYKNMGIVKAIAAKKITRKFDGIKCDIEGAELDILEKPWPIQTDTLVLEYHTSRLKNKYHRIKPHLDNLRTKFDEVIVPNDLLEFSKGIRKTKPFFDRLVWCRGWRNN